MKIPPKDATKTQCSPPLVKGGISRTHLNGFPGQKQEKFRLCTVFHVLTSADTFIKTSPEGTRRETQCLQGTR